LRTLDKSLSIVALTPDKNGSKESEDPLFSQLQLPDIFEEFCATRLLDTLNRKKVERIRSLFGEKKVHILLQHDPDPDAIGSALALKALWDEIGSRLRLSPSARSRGRRTSR
jgi:hypothetical protein